MSLASAWLVAAYSWPKMGRSVSVPAESASRGAAKRTCTASMACSATVRPNRATHACGIGPVLLMVPVAAPSATVPP